MQVNQRGEQIDERDLSRFDDLSQDELKQVLFALLRYINVRAVSTNATKHGDRQIEIRSYPC